MRIGQNPAKFVQTVPQPARVTIAIVAYIPFLSGYYAQSLEVLKTCLGSLWAHTQTPYDLLVFDNASCPEVRAYLRAEHDAGKIQALVLSAQNLGKAAAWNFIFGAAPGEIIAYADADIYFEQGWLAALVAVLDAFPNAGMVTGIPMWSPARFSTATVAWAEGTDGVTLTRGKLLAWKDYWKHARSLGQDEATARENFEKQEDFVIEDRRSKMEALALRTSHSALRTSHPARYYVGAGHFQFVARKAVLQEVIPIPSERPMGQVRRLDAAINARGYLRLSTPKWWVRHLGNTVPAWAGGGVDLAATHPSGSGRSTRAQGRVRGPLRRVVQWVYHKTFDLLYRK
ncbi:MAG: glycosyltransferase family A protein [Anaerolineales bacterium]